MLPDSPTVFISSVSGLGIDKLKDLIWTELNKETNQTADIVHLPMDIAQLGYEEEPEEEIDEEEMDWDHDSEDEDFSRYKGIGWMNRNKNKIDILTYPIFNRFEELLHLPPPEKEE